MNNVRLLLLLLVLCILSEQTQPSSMLKNYTIPVGELDQLVFHHGRSTKHGNLQLQCVGGGAHHHKRVHFLTVVCENQSLGSAFSNITWTCRGVKNPLTYYRIGCYNIECSEANEEVVELRTCRLEYTLEYSCWKIIVYAIVFVGLMWLVLGASLYGFLHVGIKPGTHGPPGEGNTQVGLRDTYEGSQSELSALRRNFSSGKRIIVYGSFDSLKSHQTVPSPPSSQDSGEIVDFDEEASKTESTIFYTDFC